MHEDIAETGVTFTLSRDERDLIVKHATAIHNDVLALLRFGVLKGKRLSYTFSPEDYDDLLEGLASEANDAKPRSRRRLFQRIFERLEMLWEAYLASIGEPLEEPPNLPDEVKYMAMEALKGVAPDDREEIDRVLKEVSAEYNRTPMDDYDGLSPNQMSRLLYADWDGPDTPLIVNNGIPLDELQGAELLVNARTFLQMLRDAGGMELTQRGNLKRKYVNEMLDAMAWPPKYVEDIREWHRAGNEEDVRLLHHLRVILGAGGLIRKYKGKFLIAKKAAQLLEEDKAGDLYASLFHAVFRRFNLAYGDGYPECPGVQHAVAYSLLMIARHAEEWISPEDLAPRLFIPAVAQEIADGSWEWDDTPGIALMRVIRPAARLGLVECEYPEEGPFLGWDIARVRKSALFDRCLSFNLSQD